MTNRHPNASPEAPQATTTRGVDAPGAPASRAVAERPWRWVEDGETIRDDDEWWDVAAQRWVRNPNALLVGMVYARGPALMPARRFIDAAGVAPSMPDAVQVDPKDVEVMAWPQRTGIRIGLETGVIVHHLPSKLAVGCRSERTQHANRNRALDGLRTLLTLSPTSARPVASARDGNHPHEPETPWQSER